MVLHTHLPWLAHAGAWPVGEEWLHQAWSASYLPLVRLLDRLAADGRRDLLTLGLTPVLAAMLDDPYCLREFDTWLGFWQLRAEGLAGRREPHLRAQASREFRAATAALVDAEGPWRHGASPVLRRLADAGVVELLGGPATHPFQPLLEPRLVDAQLAVGLDDTTVRLGRRPEGIWAPECGYRPGLETAYAAAGVRRFLVDGPTLIGGRVGDPLATADAWTVGDSDVVAFGRDLDVTYRVWSPSSGYPGGRYYRDFHTFDHDSGFRPARVTSTKTAPEDKRPYEPDLAAAAVRADAADFVDVVRRRLADIAAARDGRPGLVVVGYDTELFGHWWAEGPAWLEAVLRLLPAAGVRVSTLGRAVEDGAVAGRVDLPSGSWGSGKDWRVWDGEQVADLVKDSARVQDRLLRVLDAAVEPRSGRRHDLDQLVREAFLVTSSDWAFCVTKDSAAAYARDRAAAHTGRFDELADLVEAGEHDRALALATRLRMLDGPFGSLDARTLADSVQ
ncbi:MAG: glycoside hydrolase family 57 protein [Mycobacteriales bacterium]